MGECGCSMNDDKYTLPGPGKSFYVISLASHCCNCCAPAGISIERIDPGHVLWREYKQGEFTQGQLPLQQWPDNLGVGIVVGMEKHEFVKAMMTHLVGVSSNELGENGKIDEYGAEVIAEEMYEDACFRPKLAT